VYLGNSWLSLLSLIPEQTLGYCLPTLEQDQARYLGTLRTDLRLAGAGFFLDLGGADFMGAGVSASFFSGVALLLVERRVVVFLADDARPVCLLLLLDRVDACFVVSLRVLAVFAALVSAGASGAADSALARLDAAFVPARTVNMTGTPCLSGSRYRSLVSCRIL